MQFISNFFRKLAHLFSKSSRPNKLIAAKPNQTGTKNSMPHKKEGRRHSAQKRSFPRKPSANKTK